MRLGPDHLIVVGEQAGTCLNQQRAEHRHHAPGAQISATSSQWKTRTVEPHTFTPRTGPSLTGEAASFLVHNL